MKQIVYILIFLFISSSVFAQDALKTQLEERLKQLEETRIKLEQAYTEITIRIEELKYLLKQESNNEQSNNPKSGENIVK